MELGKVNYYQGTYEDEFDWIEECETDIQQMREDVAHLEKRIRGLEFEFRATLDPEVLIALSRARRLYIETLGTVDFLTMRMQHRLEWQLNPVGKPR